MSRCSVHSGARPSPRRNSTLRIFNRCALSSARPSACGEMSVAMSRQRGRSLAMASAIAPEPVAYIIGRREFWSLSLAVNPHTLIPRPETERLVELALERIAIDHATRIADIGTGSGAIALAIASERPRCRLIATDISPQALGLAEDNAQRLNIRNVEFRLGDGLAPLCTEHHQHH